MLCICVGHEQAWNIGSVLYCNLQVATRISGPILRSGSTSKIFSYTMNIILGNDLRSSYPKKSVSESHSLFRSLSRKHPAGLQWVVDDHEDEVYISLVQCFCLLCEYRVRAQQWHRHSYSRCYYIQKSSWLQLCVENSIHWDCASWSWTHDPNFVFFYPAVDGQNATLLLHTVGFSGSFGSAWALVTMEAWRSGNRWKIISV